MKLTTKQHAGENSWSLDTCSSAHTYENDMEYFIECCLNVGVYTLKCQDSSGDGWHGGFIEIQGTQYCEDFSGGTQKSISVSIGALGKYRFSQS